MEKLTYSEDWYIEQYQIVKKLLENLDIESIQNMIFNLKTKQDFKKIQELIMKDFGDKWSDDIPEKVRKMAVHTTIIFNQ